MSKPRVAVFAASLDPITFGHLWMIDQALDLFDQVIVAVGVNPAKSSRYMFTDDERVDMVQSLRTTGALRVRKMEMVYLVDFAKNYGANYLIRGIRNTSDFDYESTLNHINAKMAPEIKTVFLMPPPDIAIVSSSFVKGLIGYEGWNKEIRKYVPENVAQEIERKNSK